MLRNASAITDYAIAASDGRLGKVVDLLFDDLSWRVRWLVVETGGWLSGRRVVLPTTVLGRLDADSLEFPVRLTMQQVKDSPDLDTEKPVSRQMETKTYGYYGWTPYWGDGMYMGGGLGGAMVSASYLQPPQPLDNAPEPPAETGDPHLRSIEAVTGYHIHARDGEIGHVEDFLVEDVDWSIHFLVVDTKNWWPAKKVLIQPRSARTIDWDERLVNLNVDRQTVKDSPVYDPAVPVDSAFEKNFHNYYAAELRGRDGSAGNP
jgi:hypothetical protein